MSDHGTNAAYVGGCRCEDCRRATRDYHKRLIWDHHRGIRRRVSAAGTRRRIEALGLMGWTGVQIGEELGISGEHVRQLRSQRQVNLRMASRVALAYIELSQHEPPETTRPQRHNASRQRNKAEAAGWLPLDAWLNPDDPDEKPDPGYRAHRPHDDFDPVVVERVLSGDWPLAASASKAERVQIVALWTGSLNELERLTRWNVTRYVRGSAA